MIERLSVLLVVFLPKGGLDVVAIRAIYFIQFQSPAIIFINTFDILGRCGSIFHFPRPSQRRIILLKIFLFFLFFLFFHILLFFTKIAKSDLIFSPFLCLKVFEPLFGECNHFDTCGRLHFWGGRRRWRNSRRSLIVIIKIIITHQIMI